MTAGEDQAQPVILDFLVGLFQGVVRVGTGLLSEIIQRGINAGITAQRVNRLEAPGRNEPGARIGRYSIPRPLFHCNPESVLQGVFGKVKIAEQTDQGGKYAARLRPVKAIDLVMHLFSAIVIHHFEICTSSNQSPLVFGIARFTRPSLYQNNVSNVPYTLHVPLKVLIVPAAGSFLQSRR